jgi:hypothetical protein
LAAAGSVLYKVFQLKKKLPRRQRTTTAVSQITLKFQTKYWQMSELFGGDEEGGA